MPLGDGFSALSFGGGGGSESLALPTTNLVMRLQPELATLSGSNVTAWNSSVGIASTWTPTGGTSSIYSATGFSGKPGISFVGSRYLNGDATHARALIQNVGWALAIMAVRLELQDIGDYLFSWTRNNFNNAVRFGCNANSTIYRTNPVACRLESETNVIGAELPSSGSLQNTNILLAVEVDYAGTRLIQQAQNSATLSGSALVATSGLTPNLPSAQTSILSKNLGGNVTNQAILGEFSLWTAAAKPTVSPLAAAMAFYGAYYGITIT